VAYVNDILIIGPNVDNVKEALGNSFEIEDLGPGAYSPRIRISRASEALIISTAELQSTRMASNLKALLIKPNALFANAIPVSLMIIQTRDRNPLDVQQAFHELHLVLQSIVNQVLYQWLKETSKELLQHANDHPLSGRLHQRRSSKSTATKSWPRTPFAKGT
jgi:hypothetical protein